MPKIQWTGLPPRCGTICSTGFANERSPPKTPPNPGSAGWRPPRVIEGLDRSGLGVGHRQVDFHVGRYPAPGTQIRRQSGHYPSTWHLVSPQSAPRLPWGRSSIMRWAPWAWPPCITTA